MAKFDINKKGYDVEQVDKFINKLSLKYEEKLSEQKDRVFSLKNELAVMEERLNNYRDKDKQVSQALVFAVEKAEPDIASYKPKMVLDRVDSKYFESCAASI